MVMANKGNGNTTLENATENELIGELTKRHDNSPFIYLVLDRKRGVRFIETIGSPMSPPDILKSLAYLMEKHDDGTEWRQTE